MSKFRSYLKIDKSNINKEMCSLPAVVYDYGVREVTVKNKIDDLELELEERESTIAAQSRIKYKNAKQLLSETHIKDLVKSNPNLIELRKEINELKKTYRLIKMKLGSLKEKREMLVNISHNIREERKAVNLNKVNN